MQGYQFKIQLESPQYFGDHQSIKKSLTRCSSCDSKLIYQHIPNHKDMTLKEVVDCAVCEVKPTHQFFKIQ